MPKVKEIVEYFARLVPSEMKLDFDNVGLLVGMRETEVQNALIALDITTEVIEEAKTVGAQIILSHHPLYFELKQIGDDSTIGASIINLIQSGISALCLHTNLDQVKGGVNDALAEKLGISAEGYLSPPLTCSNGEAYGMGRFGAITEAMDMADFLSFTKNVLNADGLRYHNAGKPVVKLAVCGGSGGDYVNSAIAKGCDTLLTADIKHHEFLKAKALGLNIIDGGHYYTENVVVPALAEMLKKGFPDINVLISKSSAAPMNFYI